MRSLTAQLLLFFCLLAMAFILEVNVEAREYQSTTLFSRVPAPADAHSGQSAL